MEKNSEEKILQEIKKLEKSITYLISIMLENISGDSSEGEETQGSNELETPELIKEGLELRKEIKEKGVIKPMNRYIS